MPTRTPLYPTIKSSSPLVRVGVILDDWLVPAWIAEVLQSVRCSGVAEFTTIIFNPEPIAARISWNDWLKKCLSGRSVGFSTLLWRLYTSIDGRFRRKFATPFKPADVRSLLGAAKVIEVAPKRQADAYLLREPDLAAVKREDLDVILQFGIPTLTGDIISAARYGVWSYHYGDDTQYRGGPDGFWEMYDRNSVTGTVVRVLTEEPAGGRVIYRTYGGTRSFESLLVNRYWQHRKAIPFVARCLRRVYQQGPGGLDSATQATGHGSRVCHTPRNLQMLRFLMRVVRKMLFVRIRDGLGIQGNHWFLAVARGVAPGQQLNGKVIAIHPPRGRLWADPMIVRNNGQVFVFFEDFDYRLGRAHISVVELDESGRVGEARTALRADHHLSYPFIFRWKGEYFMVPETASVNAVRLYRCVEFPTRWEYVQDLLTGIEATDATLCEHEGCWYLFTTVNESGGSSWDELFLFISDTPLGPWMPHPMNPVVSDVRNARPGGALFPCDGLLYRPAQNSELTYGQSLSIMQVMELTPDRYAERLAYRIEPDWLPSIYGCHTITISDDLIALDCKTFRWARHERYATISSLLPRGFRTELKARLVG